MIFPLPPFPAMELKGNKINTNKNILNILLLQI
ncbi:hypothetical protein VIBNISOn1_450001 [Vibrio nigripulchritudo SOn1]|uniref:Uncharacterized protein n=1 Tax=Vibrio nigripulchritudo SOn1 TaxID=1238450 RepID=A0AAV2VTH7_9VIBR|nr:hypothetical protein VIBNISOn1_450001 [Vibrio nigripulchritudo SOn1]